MCERAPNEKMNKWPNEFMGGGDCGRMSGNMINVCRMYGCKYQYCKTALAFPHAANCKQTLTRH